MPALLETDPSSCDLCALCVGVSAALRQCLLLEYKY